MISEGHEISNLDAKEISESITNLLSTAGSVAPLSRGRGLILTDRLANIQRVKALIGSVDNETAAQRQMARHGWRKVQPDTEHPKSNPEIQEAFKKTPQGSWRPLV